MASTLQKPSKGGQFKSLILSTPRGALQNLDSFARCFTSLGETIGKGTTADIHARAPGQVVKLFKAGVSPRLARHEARMTRAAFAAGAPEVFDEVTLEGRLGIVLQRLDGPTLLQLVQTGAVTF